LITYFVAEINCNIKNLSIIALLIKCIKEYIYLFKHDRRKKKTVKFANISVKLQSCQKILVQ